MRKELNGLLLSVRRHSAMGRRAQNRDDPYLLAERQEIKEELAILDGIDRDGMRDEAIRESRAKVQRAHVHS